MPRVPLSTTRRRATYPAARRIARLVHELPAHPHGWSFEAIQSELAIGERTLLRYVDACRHELVDAHGAPLIEVLQRGPRRLLRLKDRRNAPATPPSSVLSMLLTLGGTSAVEEAAAERTGARNGDRSTGRSTAELAAVARLDRKFHATSFAAKDYAAHVDTLDQIVQALLAEYRLTIEVAGGSHERDDFEPYALLGDRGRLYLVGLSEAQGHVVWIPIEDLRSVTPTHGDGPLGHAPFAYPVDFHPESYADGMFGVDDGPETEVELAIVDPRTEDALRKRTIHPSQEWSVGSDGRTRLTMRVRAVDQLTTWILGHVSGVEVLRPIELRADIARRVAEASARYARPQEAAARRG